MIDASTGDITDLAARVQRELVDLIEVPSISGEEHAVVDHVERRCAELDLPCTRMPVPDGADDLVIGWDPAPALLITAHLDTIRPTWTWDGRAHVRDGRVHGLGAQDDKAGVAAALLALTLARETGVRVESLPVAVGLCVDEEKGGTGSIEMAQRLRPPHVVALEGTEMGLGTAEAGFVEAWCHLRGTAVHGALRELGSNAIESAHALIGRILEHPATQEQHPLLGRNVPMIWEIRGGGPLNVVPDECSVHVDWRVVPGGPTAASLLDWLATETAAAGGELEVVEVTEPFEIDAGAAVVAALGDAVETVSGVRPAVTGMPAWTDAHNFVDLAGSQAVVWGPGHLRHAHREDESVVLDDVVTCTRALTSLIERSGSWLPGATS